MKVEDVKLREVKIEAGAGFQGRDVYGRMVNVKVRKLKDRHKAMLLGALRVIRDRLRQPNEIGMTEDALCVAMGYTVFAVTRSKGIGAYTSNDPKCPFIVLNEHSHIWNDSKELAVTLLHELWHMLGTLGCIGDGKPPPLAAADSREEAVHDLRCYYLLDFGIPSDHWAFKTYPDLRAACK